MPIGFGYNLSSLQAQRRLAATSEQIGRVSERLASGQRINRPSDDAASLAVATKLNVDSRVYSQAMRNVNDGVSLLNVADGALSELSNLIQRQIELASQAANGTYSTTQRNSLNSEAQALRQEYNRIVQTTSFNGRMVLHGSTGQTSIQAGIGSSETYALNILDPSTAQNLTATGLGTYTNKGPTSTFGTVYTYDFGDFDENGRADVFVLEQKTNGSLYFQLFTADAQGQLSVSSQGTIADPASQGYSYNIDELGYGMGDGNGDGHLDIYLFYGLDGSDGMGGSSYHNGEVTLYGDGHGILSEGPEQSGFTFADTPTVDFNGDGVADLFTTTTTSVTSRIQNTSVQENLLQNAFSLTSRSTALSALTMLQTSLSNLSSKRGSIGAMQTRLDVGLNKLTAQRDGYRSASTRLMDADMAQESAELVRLQILQQSAASVLSQANLAPQIALSLLR